MPTPYLEKKAKESEKSMEAVERLWEEAKASAAEQGKADNYAYITAVFDRRLHRKRRRPVKKVHRTESVKKSAAMLLEI